ncbi:PIG-L deacetylase family protein [Rhodanobacter lindaniclasticus]|uniref:GlcNAc-PI de-N-acetylase n=1 Tax=Rhodanobacter lindaniclasticus TaxID=75310 RepID=A0A4S3KLG2_9GAMM|nr:PIG-L family deacetylase [Rhodanobacter lindaniclasticus]THD09609.1 GlcNAc-PI de-N-acetylase [Rhodanobacter lindaniclasticus]
MALMTGAPVDGWPEFTARTRLLVVAPHPDDETLATGLLLQQVLAAGGEVRILLLTAGGNNPWPQRVLERRWRIGAEDRRRWARRRAAELQQALATLGIAPNALQTLDWPDLGVTELLLRDTGLAVDAVRDAIDRFSPDLLAVPSLHDRHPDHSAAHVLVRLALVGHAAPPELLAYLVHGHAADRRSRPISPTPAQLAGKRAALQAHRSQLALSGRRLRRLAEREETFLEPDDPSPSVPTALPWRPPRWLGPWLRLDVVSPAATQRWTWRRAPLRRGADGALHMPLPAAGRAQPCFVRLWLDLRTPWIFDHWGWCRMDVAEPASFPGVAPQDRPG